MLLSGSEAIKMTQKGISGDDLMQSQPSHWRKNWPQGDVDDGTNDEDVMYVPALARKTRRRHGPKETYPYTLDEDVIDTRESLETSEGLTGKKLSNDGVKQRGLNWIFHYDNTKRVFERNLPYGATWKDWGVGHPNKELDHYNPNA